LLEIGFFYSFGSDLCKFSGIKVDKLVCCCCCCCDVLQISECLYCLCSSLRTSETNYLNESYAFYSAIRMRGYYSKANKEERCVFLTLVEDFISQNSK